MLIYASICVWIAYTRAFQKSGELIEQKASVKYIRVRIVDSNGQIILT